MKVLFFGYHAIGEICLRVLLESEPVCRPLAVVTHKDDPDEEIWFERPAPLAEEAGIEVVTPSKEELRGDTFLSWVRGLEPDLILSCYYRYMISTEVLAAAALGGLNLHGSYLPEYRGRCPVNWQILNGAERGGVTLHRMVKAPDAGDILDRQSVQIAPRETAHSLYLKLIPAAGDLFRRTWPKILRGNIFGAPQDHLQATYFGGRCAEDGRIDWSQGAVAADRLVRAVTHPYPGAFTSLEGRKLLIWQARPVRGDSRLESGLLEFQSDFVLVHDGEGMALQIQSLQLEGGEECSAARFLRENPALDGVILGRGE